MFLEKNLNHLLVLIWISGIIIYIQSNYGSGSGITTKKGGSAIHGTVQHGAHGTGTTELSATSTVPVPLAT